MTESTASAPQVRDEVFLVLLLDDFQVVAATQAAELLGRRADWINSI